MITVHCWDISTHLELVHRGGGLQLRVHGLDVQNGRQRHEAAPGVHQLLEHIQAHPQVVRVKVLVQGHVLEARRVLLGALRGLAEDQLAVGGAAREVAALLVGLGALAALHHEGRVLRREVLQEVCGNGRRNVSTSTKFNEAKERKKNRAAICITMVKS
jgi:hypothetical protein